VLKDSTGTSTGYLEFENFYAYVGDKISLSCQASHSDPIISGIYSFVIQVKVGDRYVVLKASTEDEYIVTQDVSTLFFPREDEAYSILDPEPKQWHSIDFEFIMPLKSAGTGGVPSNDPVVQEVNVRLYPLYDILTPLADRETWYKDMNLTITPGPARGDYNEYPINERVRKEFQFDSTLSDTNRWYMQGCIMNTDGEILDDTWKRGDNDEELMFKQILVSEYYKFMQRPRLTIDGVFKGTMYETTDIDVPYKPVGHFPVYYISAFPDKRFTIVSINEMDMKSTVWRATLVELYDITIDDYLNILPETHVYKILYK
jgi:hypothetical protein